jgi:alpha-1,2-mannosyltransferase
MTHSPVRCPRRVAAGWPAATFLLSMLGVLLSDVAGMKFAPAVLRHPFGFFDLRIYRESAGVVLSGHPLYAARFQMGFGFTYPPFAALAFIGLQSVPLGVDETVVSLVNVGLVLLIARLAIELTQPPNSDTTADRPWRGTWIVAALALWTEPIVTTIGYGQIDLAVAALVWLDLVRARDSRWGGVGIGLAAGLKLTPLMFVPYLALTGRRRAALTSLSTFAATIAISFAIDPGDAAGFWGGALFDTGRVTGHHPFAGRGPADQSLRGALLRLAAGAPHLTDDWIAACLLVGAGGLWLAVRAHQRGDDAFACVLVSITGLLICPVSWTHHWVIATPGLLLLVRRCRGRARIVGVAVALALALGSSSIWLIIAAHGNGAHLDPGAFLVGDLYVLAGLSVLGGAVVRELIPALAAAWERKPSPGHPRGQLRGVPASHTSSRTGQSA